MKKLIRMLSRVRVKFVRSSRRTKQAVICMAALSMAALLTLTLSINAIRKKTEENRKLAAQYEYENSRLEEKKENLGSAEGIGDIAQDELDMVPGDSVGIGTKPGQ